MTAMLRAALFAALAFATVPAVAAGQDTSTASLLRRVEALERENSYLERRLNELDSLIKGGPSPSHPTTTSTKWRDLANWRRLRRGLKMDEVQRLLGPPERVQAGYTTYWFWAGANVSFNRDDKLESWSEPAP